MKVLKKKKLISEGEVEHTRTEKNILINNNHPFLVNLKFSFQTEKKIYFVLGTLNPLISMSIIWHPGLLWNIWLFVPLDYVNGGELFYHLRKERRFGEDKVRFYAAEVCFHSLSLSLSVVELTNEPLESTSSANLGLLWLTHTISLSLSLCVCVCVDECYVVFIDNSSTGASA